MNRRELIRHSLLLASTPLLFNNTWAASTPIAQKKLIIVMLRGAVDGLNVVVPYQDEHYYQLRPNIALSKPSANQPDSVLDLDGYFGLNPVLAPLMPLWHSRELAFIHAAGSPSATRSHFDAQDYMETATPDIKTTRNGWLNRLLLQLDAKKSSSLQGISISTTIPRIFAGQHPITVVSPGQSVKKSSTISSASSRRLFDGLYKNSGTLGEAYQSAQVADKALQRALSEQQPEQEKAANGGQPVRGFAADARQLASLMHARDDIGFGFFGISGWDTHAAQGKEKGKLANSLTLLMNGLTELKQGLSDKWPDTVVVVMSEFGRTVKENGNQGTDHGHGNVMWLLGGAIKGKKVYGEWPTLQPQRLFENRDLAVMTDFRTVLCEVITNQFHLNPEQLNQIFPNFQTSTHALGLFT
ncbi:hypothetical protein BKE30_03285 [Alkanindiges hydrocarboniclasticus]|uniref:DUF1501 domain-containing protein n=1 Tax=Alkanindiges hydrocarboniclasticus TaxID=1907941 RepID=A0A1S8CVZ0_9GAMM|nr:DUF1501 domain-containing protein [Alkanindiges hydrocarboniclasticus]ONG41481.1 hypothetical protein BKE30_03285 [Alkanindiges hydrocarboniclasticus]